MKTKITIEAGAWKKALATLNTVVNTRSALPILADVLLVHDADRGLFQMTTADAESWLTLDCCDQEGNPWIRIIEDDARDRFKSVCIAFGRLKEAVGLLPSGALLEVYFDSDSHLMTVNYQIGQFSIPFEDSDEYPVCPDVTEPATPAYAQLKAKIAAAEEAGDEGQLTLLRTEMAGIPAPVCRFSIPSGLLLPLMKQARICAANDELRPIMNGECLEVFNDHIVVVASDGHTMFKDIIDMGLGSGWLEYGEFPAYNAATQQPGSARLIVPKTVLAALTTAFAGAEHICLTADAQRMEFRSRGVVLVSRLIDGNYPNYDSVIPTDSPHRVVVSRESLRQALRRLSLFANTGTNMAVMRRDGEKFVIEANDLDFSTNGSEQVSIQEGDAFLPEGFKIGFKISSALMLLDAIPTENVVLFFSEPAKAFLYKPEDVNSARVLLQMPMMLE